MVRLRPTSKAHQLCTHICRELDDSLFNPKQVEIKFPNYTFLVMAQNMPEVLLNFFFISNHDILLAWFGGTVVGLVV